MPEFDRKRLETSYKIFSRYTLEDQRGYYQDQVRRNRLAATQVNQIRAGFALLTGLASALAALLVFLTPQDCQAAQLITALNQTGVSVQIESTPEASAEAATPAQSQEQPPTPPISCTLSTLLIPFLLIGAVVAPALGGAFGTLADLFQWDKLVNIYDVALENLEVADAKSPLSEMEELEYRASLKAYAEGTLAIMRDETAQWGQIIRTPESLQKFIDQELRIASEASETLSPEIKAFLSGEIDSIRSASEETNRRLDELRQLYMKDAGTKDDTTGDGTTT